MKAQKETAQQHNESTPETGAQAKALIAFQFSDIMKEREIYNESLKTNKLFRISLSEAMINKLIELYPDFAKSISEVMNNANTDKQNRNAFYQAYYKAFGINAFWFPKEKATAKTDKTITTESQINKAFMSLILGGFTQEKATERLKETFSESDLKACGV